MKHFDPRYWLIMVGLLLAAECIMAANRPNVIIIMPDDHAATAIGAYGSRLASLDPTPTLDRLAAEGMVLENTFCSNGLNSASKLIG